MSLGQLAISGRNGKFYFWQPTISIFYGTTFGDKMWANIVWWIPHCASYSCWCMYKKIEGPLYVPHFDNWPGQFSFRSYLKTKSNRLECLSLTSLSSLVQRNTSFLTHSRVTKGRLCWRLSYAIQFHGYIYITLNYITLYCIILFCIIKMSPRAYGASHKCHSTLWSSERWRLPLCNAAVVVVATVLVCRDATKLGVFTAGHNVLKTLNKMTK